jgi:hypothetical protein
MILAMDRFDAGVHVGTANVITSERVGIHWAASWLARARWRRRSGGGLR